MTPDDPRNYLPTPVRESELPWTPDFEDQAAAPKDGDSWSATLGHLRFRLDVYWDTMERGDGPSSTPPDFQLHLVNTVSDVEIGSWEFPSLEIAVHVAQTLHQARLDDLCRRLSTQHHDALAA